MMHFITQDLQKLAKHSTRVLIVVNP